MPRSAEQTEGGRTRRSVVVGRRRSFGRRGILRRQHRRSHVRLRTSEAHARRKRTLVPPAQARVRAMVAECLRGGPRVMRPRWDGLLQRSSGCRLGFLVERAGRSLRQRLCRPTRLDRRGRPLLYSALRVCRQRERPASSAVSEPQACAPQWPLQHHPSTPARAGRPQPPSEAAPE